MPFDPTTLLGPIGGVIALAYAAGAASGYAFCLRTMYKILKIQADKDETECEKRLDAADHKIQALEDQVKLLNERLLHGMERQHDQVNRAGIYLLNKKDIGDE